MREWPRWRSGRFAPVAPVALFAALCAALAPAALACSVDSDYRWPTLEEQTLAADYVIVGSVEAPAGGAAGPGGEAGFLEKLFMASRGRVADIAVDRWLKGTGPASITVSGFGFGGDCRSTIPEGAAIMFLAGDAQAGGLALKHIAVNDAVVPYDPAAVERILAATAK